MMRRWIRRLAFVFLLGDLALIGYLVFGLVRWQERADPATGVAVRLSPERQVIRLGDTPRFTLTIVNRGPQAVTLVEPGDGSDLGWRTPIIKWSHEPWFSRPRCGNINALKADEVFMLRPAESQDLQDWIGSPHLVLPGRYRVAVRYTNQPDHSWRGAPLGKHDLAARQAVHDSTPVSAVSNTVVVDVVK